MAITDLEMRVTIRTLAAKGLPNWVSATTNTWPAISIQGTHLPGCVPKPAQRPHGQQKAKSPAVRPGQVLD